MRRDHRNMHHLATVSHDGRFWDAYLELEEPSTPDDPARGRIAFSAADEGERDPVLTTTIFVENSAQDVVTRARDFKPHQLIALLRSAMPPERERPEITDQPAPEPAPTEEPRNVPGPERPEG